MTYYRNAVAGPKLRYVKWVGDLQYSGDYGMFDPAGFSRVLHAGFPWTSSEGETKVAVVEFPRGNCVFHGYHWQPTSVDYVTMIKCHKNASIRIPRRHFRWCNKMTRLDPLFIRADGRALLVSRSEHLSCAKGKVSCAEGGLFESLRASVASISWNSIA